MWQKSKNIYHLSQSLLTNMYYGFPARKLSVIGVTGTSGKTTTTLMIYELLKAAGYKVSVLSTLKAIIGGEEYDTGFHVTTPDPHVLPKYMQQAVENGDTHFVLEVSSHALDQNRCAFVSFKIGVLTSLAHEHLDYHKTIENYATAKFKLLHSAEEAVVPTDLFRSQYFSNAVSLRKVVQYGKIAHKVKTFGLTEGDETQKKWKLHLGMPGDVNTLNSLAAASVGSMLGIDRKKIKRALESFPGVPGRFEEIPNIRNLRIIIDFAHKPDALEAVLLFAQGMVKKGSKIIVMYGCASERDTQKRPMMGKISAKIADITVLTDEDSRYEDSMKIINEIAQGCILAGAKGLPRAESREPRADHIFYKIPDRRDAIDFIINKLAKKGDVILLCGKGHEQSMNYKGVERPWSEHEAVRKALIS